MHFKWYQRQDNNILLDVERNFTKYNRLSTAHFLWRHDTTFTQKLIDKDMEARYVDRFHDNRWHSSKICIKMKESEDEKQSPC